MNSEPAPILKDFGLFLLFFGPPTAVFAWSLFHSNAAFQQALKTAHLGTLIGLLSGMAVVGLLCAGGLISAALRARIRNRRAP